MKTFIIFSFLWLVLALIGAGIGRLILNPSGLNEYTSPIYGKVTAKEPENHAAVHFNYEVDGKKYDGSGQAGRGNPAFDQLQIGQSIVVFYNPKNPEKAILGYPQLYAQSDYFGVLFVATTFSSVIIVPLILIYVLYQKTKRRKTT
jgi:hypothetical protein